MTKQLLTKKYIQIPLILLSIMLLLLLGFHLYRQHAKHSQAPVTIMIATDMHVLSSEYTGDYFYAPSALFDGKMTHYSNEYFDAFLAEVLEKKPSLLILSGDLTLNGSVKSHEEMTARLAKIQEAGIQVLVIPGNHDVDSTAGDYSGEEPIVVESLDGEDFSTYYESFGPAQALSCDPASFSYVYEAAPYLRILMLDTNTGVKNSISSETFEWLEKELLSAKLAGADVIAVTHQNLHIHNPLLYFTYQLYDADELLALYQKYDVALNVSGHIHVQSIVTDTIPEVAVSSLAVPNTQYGVITYDGKTLKYSTCQTDVEGFAQKNNITDENLLHFKEYSTYYFEEVAKLQVYEGLADSTLSQEEIDLLAETFAKINSAYFVGQQLDIKAHAEGISLWRAQEDSFIPNYIDTMLEEVDVNNMTLTIELK